MAVQLPPDGSGKVVDTVIVGANHRQIIVIGDPVTSAAQGNVTQYHAQDLNVIATAVYGMLTESMLQVRNASYIGEPTQTNYNFGQPQSNVFDPLRGAIGTRGVLAVVQAADPFGSHDTPIMRRTMEQILVELQTLNAYMASSGLISGSVQASEALMFQQ